MRRKARLGLALVGLTAALAVSGCSVVSGPAVPEDRAIDEVTGLALRPGGDVTVLRGEPLLTVSAPDAALGRLTSDVRDGRLVLSTTRGATWIRGSIGYTLQVDHLDEVTVKGSGNVRGSGITGSDLVIHVQGSGDVDLAGVDADRLEVVIEGSGNVRLDGRAGDVNISVAGSGNVDLDGLRATRSAVQIAGSGNVRVDVSDALDVRIAGSGDVTYTGDPSLSSQVTGSGDIRRG